MAATGRTLLTIRNACLGTLTNVHNNDSYRYDDRSCRPNTCREECWNVGVLQFKEGINVRNSNRLLSEY